MSLIHCGLPPWQTTIIWIGNERTKASHSALRLRFKDVKAELRARRPSLSSVVSRRLPLHASCSRCRALQSVAGRLACLRAICGTHNDAHKGYSVTDSPREKSYAMHLQPKVNARNPGRFAGAVAYAVP